MTELSISILIILFFVAIVASYIDTLAGGGGLVTIPALLLAGIPPLQALGTNKLQGSFGVATASWLLYKKGLINWTTVKPLMVSAFIGSVVGTIIVQFIDTNALSFIIPIVLSLILIYFSLPSRYTIQKANQSSQSISDKKYKRLVIPFIGIYDGMFGPGTGSFFTLAGVSAKKLDLISATIQAKTFNFATNIASLIVFILADNLIWLVGGVMILGQLIGSWAATHTLTKINPLILKRLIVIVCSVMLIKYGWNYF